MYKQLIKFDQDYCKKRGCISDNDKICLNELYNEKKFELNQVIKENTYDEKLKVIPIVISKYCCLFYEITV